MPPLNGAFELFWFSVLQLFRAYGAGDNRSATQHAGFPSGSGSAVGATYL
jgi:hypothetical protein